MLCLVDLVELSFRTREHRSSRTRNWHHQPFLALYGSFQQLIMNLQFLLLNTLYIYIHSGLPDQYVSKDARPWLHWPQRPVTVHQLPYMVKSTQKHNHPLHRLTAHCVKRSEKYPNFTTMKADG